MRAPERAYHSSVTTRAGALLLRLGRSSVLRIALLVIAAAALVFAALNPAWSFLAIVVASLSLLIVASSSSEAGRLAVPLQTLGQQRVNVRVWGEPLQTSPLDVVAVTAVGPGLLIYLRDDGPQILLKVAQPRFARIEQGTIEIGDARYVSWGGVKLRRVAGIPAVVISTAC